MPLGTAAVVGASVEVASTVVVSVVAVSTAVVLAAAFMPVASMVALRALDTLEAESAAAGVASALGERGSQVTFRTLRAQDPGSLRLVIHLPGSPCMMDDLVDP